MGLSEGSRSGEGKHKWRRAAVIAAVSILALLLVLVLSAAIYWNAMLNKINRMDDQDSPTLSSEEMDAILNEFQIPNAENPTDPTDPLVTDPGEVIGTSEKIINIMLLGRDTRDGKEGSRGRSDTMILCTINTEDKTVTFTSFQRDLYVKLPDFNGKQWGYNRLNANYALGGREMLDLCLQMNFGIHVDHFVEVDFDGFAAIVELMGGVDLELTQKEAWFMNMEFRNFREGMNHLNGEQALYYARMRKLDGDFNRTGRQRYLLTELMKKVKQMTPAQIHELLSQALPLLTTDMTNGEITDYALTLVPMVQELEVKTMRIPVDNTYYPANKGTADKKMYVIIADLEANRQALRENLGTDSD